MIRYHRHNWWGQVFVLQGGIFSSIWMPAAMYLLYTVLVYVLSSSLSIEEVLSDDHNSVRFFGSVVSFLLIFRLNQCYVRYNRGAEFTALFFSSLHAVASTSLVYIKASGCGPLLQGAEDDEEKDPEKRALAERLALLARVHIVRLVLAIGASLKFHCRVAEHNLSGGCLEGCSVPLIVFDLQRVKGLLLPEEQEAVDEISGIRLEDIVIEDEGQRQRDCKIRVCLNYRPGPSSGEASTLLKAGGTVGVALPLLLVLLLRDVVYQPLSKKWGYPERVMNLIENHLSNIATSFEEMDRLITFPIPMAYLQHCKVIFLVFILTYPLTLPTSDGIWAKVISPVLMFLAVFGLEILADQMENPLGDDEQDFNLLEMQHELELRTLQAFALTVSRREYMRKSWSLVLDKDRESGPRSSLKSSGGRRPSECSVTGTDSGRSLPQAQEEPSRGGAPRRAPEEEEEQQPPPGAAAPRAEKAPEQRAGAERDFEFLSQFAWVEFPGHVVDYMTISQHGDVPAPLSYLRKGVERWPIRRWLQCFQVCLEHAGPGYQALKAADGAQSRDAAGGGDAQADGATYGVSHFVCLRSMESELHRVCDLINRSTEKESELGSGVSPTRRPQTDLGGPDAEGMPQSQLRKLLEAILDPAAKSRAPEPPGSGEENGSTGRLAHRQTLVQFQAGEDDVSEFSYDEMDSEEEHHLPQSRRVSSIWATRSHTTRKPTWELADRRASTTSYRS